MNQPLVSVICLSFNHEKFVERAVLSVLNQTYKNIELIIVDDASTDGSAQKVKTLGEKYNLRTLLLPTNQGNCKAFNAAFSISKGQFIIDLAADDVLFPDRIQVGVDLLEKKGKEFGVHFCDIELINAKNKSLGTHFKRDSKGQLLDKIQEGDIYKILLEKYYISTPTMMMRREVLEKLGGYDENLTYEDFDFWIRSSREYKYCFSDKVLMQKQIVHNSHSAKQYQKKNPQTMSTAMVCMKALELNKTPAENDALLKRTNYELKWALITENWEAAELFIKIKKQLNRYSIRLSIERLCVRLQPSWYWLWKLVI